MAEDQLSVGGIPLPEVLDAAILAVIAGHADLVGRIALTYQDQSGATRPTQVARVFASALYDRLARPAHDLLVDERITSVG